MPDAIAYQRGFGLQVGQIYGGYRMDTIKIGHDQVKLWNEYAYPCTLTFTWVGTTKADEKTMMALFIAFTNKVEGIKIIRSESERPYKCLFQYPITSAPGYHVDPTYTQVSLVYKGYAKRIGEAEASAILSGKQGWDK